MRRLLFTFLMLAASAVPASGKPGVTLTQPEVTGNPLPVTGRSFQGMLDLSKFDMQHTAGINFGTGSSGFSQYYVNTMTYKPTPRLTVQASVGIQNLSAAAGAFGQPVNGTRIVVPNVGVLYQPTPKLRIEFGFSNVPSYYGYGGPWGRRGF